MGRRRKRGGTVALGSCAPFPSHQEHGGSRGAPAPPPRPTLPPLSALPPPAPAQSKYYREMGVGLGVGAPGSAELRSRRRVSLLSDWSGLHSAQLGAGLGRSQDVVARLRLGIPVWDEGVEIDLPPGGGEMNS